MRSATSSTADTEAERAVAREQITRGSAEPIAVHTWRHSSVSEVHGAAIDGMGVVSQTAAFAGGRSAEA